MHPVFVYRIFLFGHYTVRDRRAAAQLYEMCKDGNNASDSTVVLMVVALFYKLVLVVIGLMLPVVWLGHMREYLGSWLGLYVVGIVLNVVLVALLCGVSFRRG